MSDLTSRLAQLSPAQRAELAERLAAARAPSVPEHAVAVVGMACRLPGGVRSPEQFWQLLTNGVDAMVPVPADRWDAESYFDADPDAPGRSIMRSGGFIDGVADFDAGFFGISPFEARQMDPQQRIFLEVAMDALHDAGYTRAQLAGSQCGVFVGVHSHSSEYYAMQAAAADVLDTYSSTGTAHSVVANRVSYCLDLRGPSMAIDTACSSSLVALHQACLSLRAGESSMAIAGGVNLMLSPDFTVALTKLRVLSPSGRCRTFDANADGIARGEGCGALVLKRAADAVRDGDPILALIRGTAVNQDGATNGLTAPNTASQVAVIRAALQVAQLDASRIGFVETHGTGTTLGDPIEVDAIAASYGRPRAAGDQVVLGALKTNIGHLEGAAGVAAVIKTVLCLRHGHIPKNLHFSTPNPLLRLDGTSIALATDARAGSAAAASRVGAVSSFGFGGTNAHAILEESQGTAASPASDASETVLPLLLSAHTEVALRAQVAQWQDRLSDTTDAVGLRDLAYTAAVRRTPYPWRVAVSGRDRATWGARLAAWSRASEHDTLKPLREGQRRKVAFVFCGQGPQWFAMGRDLLASEPVCREVVTAVADVVTRVAGWDLWAELGRDEQDSRVHETSITQPAIFAIQMALVALWRSWGIEPDFVIGHSMGEIAAACTAGAIDLAEGARIAVHRGRAVSQAEGLGAMIAFPVSASVVTEAIAGMEDRVGIAAINAPESVVLAGDAASLAIVRATMQRRGVDGKALEVRYASHSPQMAPLVGWLRTALGHVTHRAPNLPMYSSISHGLVTGATLDAEHWSVGLRRPVDFAGGVTAALSAGCQAFVDIAPHPVMAGSVRETAAALQQEVVAVASLRRNTADREQLMQSLCELHVAGVEIDWLRVLGARGTVVPLPAYPWQRTRYWIPERDQHAPAPVLHSAGASSARPDVVAASTAGNAACSEAVEQDDVLHAVAWRVSVPVSPAAARQSAGRYIVLGGAADLACVLATRLHHGGIEVLRLAAASADIAVASARADGGDIIDLRATDLSRDLTMLRQASSASSGLQQLMADLSTASAASAETAQASRAAVANHAHVNPRAIRVWSVTRGAQTPSGETPDAAQAAVWGIGRVAAVELPTLWGGMIDLDPAASVAQSTDDLVDAIRSPSTECETVCRAGQRLVPRFSAITAAPRALRLDRAGYYVVSGGLGGVGLVVADWLSACGAARVLLIARTPLPSRERWDDPALTAAQRRRIAGVQRLEARGTDVMIASADVSDRAAIADLVAQCRAAGWGSARGILHCAMDQQFGLLYDTDASAIDAMMRTKLGGADALCAAYADDAPDFLVMFSSLASLLGERGQGAYAAANAALDAWSLTQRQRGLPVSVVNWGAWEETGLAATRGGALVTDGLALRGVLAVSPAIATDALGMVIAHQLPSAAVFRVAPVTAAVNSGLTARDRAARDPWIALASLQRALVLPTVAGAADALHAAIMALPGAGERAARLTEVLRDLIADTLGITDARIDIEQPLGMLGMDSLMAIRIRRRCEKLFGMSLPATALFSYPTVAAFAAFIGDRLQIAAAAPAPDADVQVPPAPAAISTLSDDEALAALRGRPVRQRVP